MEAPSDSGETVANLTAQVMSLIGTEQTCQPIRRTFVIGGKANSAWTWLEGNS